MYTKTFLTLRIDLGGSEMQTPDEALNAITESIHQYGRTHNGTLGNFHPGAHASMRDVNGNTVGSWQVETITMHHVGDIDPTPDLQPGRNCGDVHLSYICTWPEGHNHPQHVAGGLHQVHAVWDVKQ